jgi:hypothetical protein
MDITWSDSIRAAFASCLPCLISHDSPPSPGPDRVPRARPDELEGLLADTDALSLHSNIGFPGRRKRTKKNRGLKRISIFGYDLFGRPPIQLPTDDEENDPPEGEGRRERTTSSSTLDSDAAPLDASAIQNLSSPRPPPPELSAEEQEKEARRQRRRERKERKFANTALSSQATDEFEGFPGSGSGPPIRSPLEGSQHTHSSTPSSHTIAVDASDDFEGFPGSGSHVPRRPHAGSSRSDDFGEFAQADFGGIKSTKGRTIVPHEQNGRADGEVDGNEDEDLGGELYSRHRAGGSSHGSDSRSRTSGSQSQHSQGRFTQQQSHRAPLPHSPTATSFSNPSSGGSGKRKPSPLVPTFPAPSPLDGTPIPDLKRPPPRKTKSKSKSGDASLKSTSTKAPSSSSQPSLPSPAHSHSQFSSHHRPQVNMAEEPEEFEGFPMDSGGGSGFPSTGFGGGRERLGGKGRDMGAFLASRGNS